MTTTQVLPINCKAGNAMITLAVTECGTYAVTTMIGTDRCDDFSRIYATEGAARSAARHTAVAFREHGTDVAIETRRHALTFAVRDALNSRRSNATIKLADAEAALDAIATLADRAAAKRA